MAGTMCLGSVYTSSAEGEGQDAGPLEEKRVAPTPRFSWGGGSLCHFLHFGIYLEFSIMEVKKKKKDTVGDLRPPHAQRPCRGCGGGCGGPQQPPRGGRQSRDPGSSDAGPASPSPRAWGH